MILRKPELHDVLHDGLVLYRKSPHPRSRSTSSRLRSRSLSNLNTYLDDDELANGYPYPNIRAQPRRTSLEYAPLLYSTDYEHRPTNGSGNLAYCGRRRSGSGARRRPRSLSPRMISLNRDLARENYRAATRSRSRSGSGSRSCSVSPNRYHHYDLNSSIDTRSDLYRTSIHNVVLF